MGFSAASTIALIVPILLVVYLSSPPADGQSYLDDLHNMVDQSGQCVQSDGTTHVDVVEDEVKSCTAVSSGLSKKQKRWLAKLGKKVRNTDTTGNSRVTRKELRQYSNSEWDDVVEAITAMQTTFVGDTSEYGIFVRLHQHDVGPAGTRAGPGSWGWHREYLARFEKAMQSHVAGVSLPYWDVSLDTYLPIFHSSVLWSDALLGRCGTGESTPPENTTAATVDDGRFANWELAEPCAGNLLDENHVRYGHTYSARSCNIPNTDAIEQGENAISEYIDSFNDAELSYVLDNYDSFTEFSYDLCLLADHDELHGSVGGTSEYIDDKSCAVADPIMWFMHTYLDYVWEMFRQSSQKTNLETDYMDDSQVLECHSYNADMTPFDGLKNSDGLSTLYTDYVYTYEESPMSCRSTSDCYSTSRSASGDANYLWCDKPRNRCKSRVKMGDSCEYLTDASDACESGSSCQRDEFGGYVCQEATQQTGGSSSSGHLSFNTGKGTSSSSGRQQIGEEQGIGMNSGRGGGSSPSRSSSSSGQKSNQKMEQKSSLTFRTSKREEDIKEARKRMEEIKNRRPKSKTEK